MTRSVNMLKLRLNRDQGFDDHVADARPKRFNIVTLLLQKPIEKGKISLASSVAILGIFVCNKIRVGLVNCIVGQMNPRATHVFRGWFLVLFRAKSDQAFFEQENPKRIAREDQNVHSHVELESLDQQRLLNVFLNDAIRVFFRIVGIFSQNDALSLASSIRFDDISRRLLFELLVIFRALSSAKFWETGKKKFFCFGYKKFFSFSFSLFFFFTNS